MAVRHPAVLHLVRTDQRGGRYRDGEPADGADPGRVQGDRSGIHC